MDYFPGYSTIGLVTAFGMNFNFELVSTGFAPFDVQIPKKKFGSEPTNREKLRHSVHLVPTSPT